MSKDQVEYLLDIVRKGDRHGVKEYINNHGSKICQIVDQEGWTALHFASLYGHFDIVKALLGIFFEETKGTRDQASTTSPQEKWMNIQSENIDPAQKICSSGVTNTECNKWKTTSSVPESQSDDQRDTGSNEEKDGSEAFSTTATSEDDVHEDTKLRRPTKSIWSDKETTLGHTALHWAAFKGHVKIVKLLIDSGFDTDARSKFQASPLQVAAASGHLDVVKVLLQNGCITNVKTESGSTPLSAAIAGGHVDVVNLVLSYGADPTFAET